MSIFNDYDKQWDIRQTVTQQLNAIHKAGQAVIDEREAVGRAALRLKRLDPDNDLEEFYMNSLDEDVQRKFLKYKKALTKTLKDVNEILGEK